MPSSTRPRTTLSIPRHPLSSRVRILHQISIREFISRALIAQMITMNSPSALNMMHSQTKSRSTSQVTPCPATRRRYPVMRTTFPTIDVNILKRREIYSQGLDHSPLVRITRTTRCIRRHISIHRIYVIDSRQYHETAHRVDPSTVLMLQGSIQKTTRGIN